MTAALGGQKGQSGEARLYLYFASLILLVALGAPNGYLVAISAAFILKNQLGAAPAHVALFSVVTSLPLYLACVFGFVRDQWNPFGMRDRGFLVVFAPLTALFLVSVACSRLTFPILLTGVLLSVITFSFVNAAYVGLMALIAQERLMSGRLSSLLGGLSLLPAAGGAFASGWFAEHVSAHGTFLAAAGLALATGLFGIWKPRAVFEHAYDQPAARGVDLWGDIQRLAKHRPLYPAVLINFMYEFMPGGTTPMQYYLTDRLHAPDEFFGFYMGIFVGAFIPIYFLYGWLCKRVPLKRLLLWGTIIMIPQNVPLVFVHTGDQALLLAVPQGLMGGIAAASYMDLAMRSCPPGLQGTFMSLFTGFGALSATTSNALGAAIYGASPLHGFVYDVIASCCVFAAIIPVLKLVPKEVIATSDGERNPAINRQEQTGARSQDGS